MADEPQEEGKSPSVDPLRVVRLLWDAVPPPARGRKPGILLDDIVGAGIRIADAKGVDALSMRQVAAELDVGTMSLYTYVSSKAELVELMVDRALGELRRPDPGAPPRERVATLATESWELYHRHPWILQTNLWRFSLGPNALDRGEAMYAALDAWGVDVLEIFGTASLIESFVQGAARSSVIDRQTEELTGESFDDYFTARRGFWEEYFDMERYPMHVKIWTRGGFDHSMDPFRFGLERLLDAIELRVSTDHRRGAT